MRKLFSATLENVAGAASFVEAWMSFTFFAKKAARSRALHDFLVFCGWVACHFPP